MSLKAKIEAVIYASEEPVTLAQLAGLLGQEAQHELDRLAARQQRLHLAGSEGAAQDAQDIPSERGEYEQTEPEPTEDFKPVLPEPTEDMGRVAAPEEHAEGIAEAEAAATDVTAPDATAEKRIARERERKLRDFLRETVAELIKDYAESDRGIEIREVANGFRMATKPEYHDAVRGFVKSLKPPLTLTLQALETLAVIAYKQPVTSPEISEIRGVDSSGVLGSLMARKLIMPAGRKQVIGRPILYKTTKDFLLRFGLKDVGELPSIEEFEKMAGELADNEPVQEEIEMSHSIDASEPQADGDDRRLEEDDSNLPVDELPAVDGRLSGLPPKDLQVGEDPSADEAEIQSGE